jgi:hypothetical protein
MLLYYSIIEEVEKIEENRIARIHSQNNLLVECIKNGEWMNLGIKEKSLYQLI